MLGKRPCPNRFGSLRVTSWDMFKQRSAIRPSPSVSSLTSWPYSIIRVGFIGCRNLVPYPREKSPADTSAAFQQGGQWRKAVGAD